MTKTELSVQLIVYQADGSTPALTLTRKDIVTEDPVYGGQRFDFRTMLAASRPWTIEVRDTGVTAELGDADGRAQLLGRLVRLQISEGGGGYVTKDTGRLQDIGDTPAGTYLFTVTDERWVERGNTIFTSAETTSIAPPGLVVPYGPFPLAGEYTWIVDAVAGDDVFLFPLQEIPLPRWLMDLLRGELKGDITTGGSTGGVGNFRTLRFLSGGTDYEVYSFAPGINDRDLLGHLIEEDDGGLRFMWVSWPGHTFVVDDLVDGSLRTEGHEPTENIPLHIAGADGWGIDPMQLLRDVWDGDYGGTPVQYDASVFTTYDPSTNPLGLLGRFPKVRHRITESAVQFEWVNANIFEVFGVVPFRNDAGVLAPRCIWLPQDIDPTTLPTATVSKVSEKPSWDHSSADIITRVVFEYLEEMAVPAERLVEERDAGIDLIKTEAKEELEDHDRTADLGVQAHKIAVMGLHTWSEIRDWLGRYSREAFERMGDGPQAGEFPALRTLDGVHPGDYIILNGLPLPNLETGAKGGQRLVQAVNRYNDLVGPVFGYLDAGPSSQPLQAPSVAIAQNAADPKHAVDVTISLLPADATGWALELDIGGAGYTPAATGTANGVTTVPRLPSGTIVKPRVVATGPNRIRSAYATAPGVATAALEPPTAVTVTPAGRTADVSWTLGEAEYGLRIRLDGVDLHGLPAGSTMDTLENLALSTIYTVDVRHEDPYGGASAWGSSGFTTTGTADQAPALLGLNLLAGEPA